MDINYICEFVVLAEVENYMTAADQLFISPSALSRHIKTIEEELGVPIFERTTRHVRLNSYGELFLPYAQSIARTKYEYSTVFNNALNIAHGTVRIGTIPVMAQYGITDILARFRKENPNFSLDVTEADPLILIKKLHNGELDFAFIRELPSEHSDTDLKRINFTSDVLVAVLSTSHPLAKRSHIHIKELSNLPIATLSPETFMYSLCYGLCQKAGFEPNITFTTHRVENLLEIVSKGGIAGLLMKKPVIYINHSNVTTVEIEPRITTTINLVYSKALNKTPAATHFISMFQSL